MRRVPVRRRLPLQGQLIQTSPYSSIAGAKDNDGGKNTFVRVTTNVRLGQQTNLTWAIRVQGLGSRSSTMPVIP